MRPLALSTVLVATDLEASDAALRTGQALATGSGAALHVVHVEGQGTEEAGRTHPTGSAAGAVEEALRRAGIAPRTAKVHIVPGPAADSIRSIADLVAADVVVVGPSRGRARSAPALPAGGTALAVVLGASAPCLVAVEPIRLPLTRVLVPVDLSDTSRGALLVALSWASALRAGTLDAPVTTLTALHVEDAQPNAASEPTSTLEDEVGRLRRDAGDWAGVMFEAIRVPGGGEAAAAIADAARERHADLVVLGTRGRGLDAVRRLGSVTAAVVERAPSPMLLVPPSVWRGHASDD